MTNIPASSNLDILIFAMLTVDRIQGDTCLLPEPIFPWPCGHSTGLKPLFTHLSGAGLFLSPYYLFKEL